MEKHLWQAFRQASRWQEGNGIGLYHMKELVGCLGGSVGYQANVEEGHGSLFWADLPLQPISATPPAEHKLEQQHPQPLASPQQLLPTLDPQLQEDGVDGAVAVSDSVVLLVEDDVFLQELTTSLIKSLGVTKVKLAVDGLDALAVLQAPVVPIFTLVLMDVNMPGMSGIECTRHIRAWELDVATDAPLKILALSANGDDPACQRACIEAGMDGVMCKPLQCEMLRGHLSGCL